MSATITILGTSILVLLLAGYLAQNYLPPPKPKIFGIDLGTTYSCIGVYHAVSGDVNVIPDQKGHNCLPSTVSFSQVSVKVGYDAAAHADIDPYNTIYDAKRFIGKMFKPHELQKESQRYPFTVKLNKNSMAEFVIGPDSNRTFLAPETIGSHILETLKQIASTNLSVQVTKAVMSVPAEFNEIQRNYTKLAAKLAGIEVLRVINEPTAAALAYGLHKKEGVRNVMVVDLGGGTLDVSLLNIMGGMFSTQGMAGNNHLGGQDFNQRLMTYLLDSIKSEYQRPLSDPIDLQTLREITETTKLHLTNKDSFTVMFPVQSFKTNSHIPLFKKVITRQMFEDLNMDLFKKVLEPIRTVLEETELTSEDVDEVVLVGGSTRIPKVRKIIEEYFHKPANVAIDPELAVVYGVSIQAGIIGGMWPLTVSAIELPSNVRKIHVY